MMAKYPSPQFHGTALFLTLLTLLAQVNSEPDANPIPNAALVSQFPLLNTLTAASLKHASRLGEQNFTICCLQAVTQSYVLDAGGQLISNPDSSLDFIGLSPAALAKKQFPCGATYNNDDAGAPPVTIPYTWCRDNCSGWQKSKNSALNEWVQPFVGFILPAAVFCLNIPRKAKFAIPDDLFKDAFSKLLASLLAFSTSFMLIWNRNAVKKWGFVRDVAILALDTGSLITLTVLRGTLAAGIAIGDTMLWIGICFSEAGPMVLSGLYEAALDRKILREVHKQIETRREIAQKVKNARDAKRAEDAAEREAKKKADAAEREAKKTADAAEREAKRKTEEAKKQAEAAAKAQKEIEKARRRQEKKKQKEEKGDKGDKGDKGEKGEKRVEGDKGDKGEQEEQVGKTTEVTELTEATGTAAAANEEIMKVGGTDEERGRESEDNEKKKTKPDEAHHETQPEDHDAQPPDNDTSPQDNDAQPQDHNIQPEDHDAQPEDHKTQPQDLDTQPEDHDAQPRESDLEPVYLEEAPQFYRRIHMLYAVLVGNLTMDQDGKGQRNAWTDVINLVDSESDREKIQTRLTGMLGCQASFGAAIGAPVVFFLGSFLFSVFSNLNAVGDNDTSHALAFGMWWMTIPHVAIVGGCLLAGNNPNTLEVIMCGMPNWNIDPLGERSLLKKSIVPQQEPQDNRGSDTLAKRSELIRSLITAIISRLLHLARPLYHLYRPFYDSLYQPVWMWERGRSKRNWIRRVLKHRYIDKEPSEKHDLDEKNGTEEKQEGQETGAAKKRDRLAWIGEAFTKYYASFYEDELLSDIEEQRSLQEKQRMYKDVHQFDLSFWDWVYLVAVTVGLMLIPFVLAFITSFFTPTIGLSCRTLTFLLYFCFQLWLCFIWCWDFHFPTQTLLFKPARRVPIFHIRPTFYCLVRGFGILGSLFTAVIGTFLQIVGVFRNCLCNLPVGAWAARDFSFVISTNSAAQIFFANHYWLRTGIASIVLLVVVCYVGWWYQRHWRFNFSTLIVLAATYTEDRVVMDEAPEAVQAGNKGEKDASGIGRGGVQTNVVDVTEEVDAIRLAPRRSMQA